MPPRAEQTRTSGVRSKRRLTATRTMPARAGVGDPL